VGDMGGSGRGGVGVDVGGMPGRICAVGGV
jgi:hypothetical protein